MPGCSSNARQRTELPATPPQTQHPPIPGGLDVASRPQCNRCREPTPQRRPARRRPNQVGQRYRPLVGQVDTRGTRRATPPPRPKPTPGLFVPSVSSSRSGLPCVTPRLPTPRPRGPFAPSVPRIDLRLPPRPQPAAHRPLSRPLRVALHRQRHGPAQVHLPGHGPSASKLAAPRLSPNQEQVSRLCGDARTRPVLVVDEAHHLRPDVLEDLRCSPTIGSMPIPRLCLLLRPRPSPALRS